MSDETTNLFKERSQDLQEEIITKRPTVEELLKMLSSSSIGWRPPRTSTPTPSSTPYQIDSNSSSGASTATNNNRYNQFAYTSQYGIARDTTNNDNNSEDDTLNISRETDESTNLSTHNQSGCELIGVSYNSDQKDTPEKNPDTEQTPYTVEFFNDTSLQSPSSYSPPERSGTQSPSAAAKALNDKYDMSGGHEFENKSLRKLVTALQNEVETLNNKVSALASKVEDLESKLEREKSTHLLNKSEACIYNGTQQSNSTSSIETMQKHNPLSKSVSTINKLTPMKNSRHNNSHGSMSTYSRSAAATAMPQSSAKQNSFSVNNSQTSQTLSTSAKRLQQSKSYNNGSMSRPNIKSDIYTSTSSLYADSNKSISPTQLESSNSTRQYTSPSSYLNLSQKRDTSAYNSMLSLSSIGNSTLKKASVAGSISNLSQFSTSHLSNWPSISNFIDPKHQAKEILYDEDEQTIRMVLYNSLITMRVPSWLRDQYCLDGVVMEPPAVRLKLEWVHGYRGRDCRSNIYYLPTGECIYFVASVVILYNPEEKTQRHYLGHTDSVKCLAVHPNKLIVASGQSAIANRRDKRPIVRVWNTVSLATLRVIGFNEDFDRSICCLAFSKHDAGATLAVVDESSEHTITLLDWQREKNWRVAEVNSGHEPVLAIDFHPMDKYSLVAVGKSSINFWDIRGMTLAKKAGLFDKYDRPKYVLCMTFNDIGETITGDSNGNIIIWPRGTNKPRRIIRDAHPGGVFSVLAMKDGSYLTGGRDRRVVEWDENFEPTGREAGLPEHCGGVRFITYARGLQVFIGTLRNSILMGSIENGFHVIVQGHTEATSALAIHPIERKYLTGGFDEQIHLTDAQTHLLEWSKCLAMPITAASFSPNGVLLIIGSTSGNWLAMDAVNQDILFTACDGTGTINCIKFSPNGEYFCFGSSDCQVYIYSTNPDGSTFCRIGTCVGHSAPIKEIDWSDDNAYIQSQSMNFELLFWKVQNCRPVDNDAIVHDLRWATHNCTIGFNVIGIWSDLIDSALINYCDKSNNDKYIVSATDTGYINVYRWPTYYSQCLSQKYYGNVDKFNFIKFLQDDSSLIAVGTKSCVTTEWSIIAEDDS
jgi:microtubule-associated protein-like 1/2